MNKMIIVDFIMKCLLVVSLILFIVTVILLVSANSKKKDSYECTGIIVDFYKSNTLADFNSSRTYTISPIVSYSVDGKTYEFIGSFYSTNMKVGQEVKVLYNKDNPADAAVFSGLNLAPIITGLIALVFLLPPIVYFLLKTKLALYGGI